MRHDELKLDGNAIAGLLQEIFATEVTTAGSTCGGCGKVHPFGAVDVYAHAPGVVVRCLSCNQVLMRVVRGGGRLWLDLSGTRCLEIADPSALHGVSQPPPPPTSS